METQGMRSKEQPTDALPCELFRCSALGLGATLRAKGIALRGLEPSEEKQGRFEFVFDLAEDQGEELARNYCNRLIEVDARSLVEEIGALKGLVFRAKRGNGNEMRR
jgi:hypothetical protein